MEALEEDSMEEDSIKEDSTAMKRIIYYHISFSIFRLTSPIFKKMLKGWKEQNLQKDGHYHISAPDNNSTACLIFISVTPSKSRGVPDFVLGKTCQNSRDHELLRYRSLGTLWDLHGEMGWASTRTRAGAISL
jgi:hypothetical protein